MEKTANIIEIFSSIQGEGPYIGCKQIFVRFARCNLSCKYCDTPFKEQEFCNIYLNKPEKLQNPISTEKLMQIISNFSQMPHHSISFTGGEPLLHTEFLSEFLPEFKKTFPKIKTYLETNGTLFEELNQIIENIDIISMDLKLKSSTESSIPLDKHKKFIETALKAQKEIYLKTVVSNKVYKEEIYQICELINSFENKILLVLQPVDSKNKEILLSPEELLKLQEKFLKKLDDVRVIPQVHKFLDLL
jgi:organic radical activating enzyme